MIDPLTTIATAAATLIVQEAVKANGQKLGETVYNKLTQLINLIRQKFQAEGVEGKLTKAQTQPNETTQSRLEQELLQQMEDDSNFAKQLQQLVNELKSNPQVQQEFLIGVEVGGDAEIGNISQSATGSGSAKQTVAKDVKVTGNLKIGDLTQDVH